MKNQLIEKPDLENQIEISTSSIYRVVDKSDIMFLQSDSCYTRIFLNDNSAYTICKTLKKYRILLQGSKFINCHKSFLVNVHYVKEIISQKKDYIILTNGNRIPIARRRVNETKKQLILSTIS